jgi:hypothetical protein
VNLSGDIAGCVLCHLGSHEAGIAARKAPVSRDVSDEIPVLLMCGAWRVNGRESPPISANSCKGRIAFRRQYCRQMNGSSHQSFDSTPDSQSRFDRSALL